MTQSECRTQRRLTKHSPIKLLQKMLVCGVVFGAMGNCVADQIPDTHFSPVLIAGTVLVDALESHDDREVFHLNSSERIWRDNSWGTQRTAYRVDFVGRCGSWTNDPLGAPQPPGISCQPLEPLIGLIDNIVTNEDLSSPSNAKSEYLHGIIPDGIENNNSRDPRPSQSSFVELGRNFKIGHSVIEVLVAIFLLLWSHAQVVIRPNLRGLAILILFYIAAFTLLAHAFSVLIFF